MDENTSQSNPNHPIPPRPNEKVVPSPVISNHTTPNTSQITGQVIAESKSKRFSAKKIIIFLLIPVVLMSFLLIFAFTGMNRVPDIQSKYSPRYIPSNLQKTDVSFKELQSGQSVYTVVYEAEGWSFVYFAQRHNSKVRECVLPPKRETSTFTNFHEFLPRGSILGCVYTSTSNDSETVSHYFRWFNGEIWFELTTLNYDLVDKEALKFANSLSVEKITFKDKLQGVIDNVSDNVFWKVFIY